MSEKTFKVGDRVRVTSVKPNDYDGKSRRPYWTDSMEHMLGKCGTVFRVVDSGSVTDIRPDGFEGIWCWINRDLELVQDDTPQEPRLPQVGEVWRSRDGKFTVKLEPNDEPATLLDGYVLGGHCSDKAYRTFTADGAYWNDRSEAGENLVELVSEAEKPAEVSVPEPQVNEKNSSAIRFIKLDEAGYKLGVLDLQYGDVCWFSRNENSDRIDSIVANFNSGENQRDEFEWSRRPEHISLGDLRRSHGFKKNAFPGNRQQLEASVDVAPLDPATTELHQAIEDPVERFDAINLAVIQDAISGKRGPSQLLIAREVLRFGSLLCRKNNDYGDSAWKPPRLAPGCDAGTAIRVRMSDKLERIESLLTRSQEVKDESIDDTLRDLAAYILLDLARPGRSGVEAK